MSLFYQQPRRHRVSGPWFPAELRRVTVICNCRTAHVLPVRMVRISETVAQNGSPMVVMACPYPGCDWREGWVIDFRTGRPRRLWAAHHDGR